jgi:hypothetical protein
VPRSQIITFAALPNKKTISFSPMVAVQVAPLSAVTFVHLFALGLMSPLETFGVDARRGHRLL